MQPSQPNDSRQDIITKLYNSFIADAKKDGKKLFFSHYNIYANPVHNDEGLHKLLTQEENYFAAQRKFVDENLLLTNFMKNRSNHLENKNYATNEITFSTPDDSCSFQPPNLDEILSCEIIPETPFTPSFQFGNTICNTYNEYNKPKSFACEPYMIHGANRDGNGVSSQISEGEETRSYRYFPLNDSYQTPNNYPDISITDTDPNHDIHEVFNFAKMKKNVTVLQDVRLPEKRPFTFCDHNNLKLKGNCSQENSQLFNASNQTQNTDLRNINNRYSGSELFEKTLDIPLVNKNNNSPRMNKLTALQRKRIQNNDYQTPYSSIEMFSLDTDSIDKISFVDNNIPLGNVGDKSPMQFKKIAENKTNNNISEQEGARCISNDFFTGISVNYRKPETNKTCKISSNKIGKTSRAKKTKKFVMEVSRTPVKEKKTKQKKLTDMLDKKERVKCHTIVKKETKNPKVLKQSKIDFSANRKFCTPFKSQLNEKDAKYEIVQLAEDNVKDVESQITSGHPIAILFDVIFREGFCQLTKKSSLEIEGDPTGILFACYWTLSSASHYYLDFETTQKGSEILNLFQFLLGPGLPSRRVCFGSKTLFRNLLGRLGVPFRHIKGSLLWDALIGCWLLDPVGRLSSFGGVQDMVGVRDRFTVTSSDPLVNACHMMTVLLKVDKKLRAFLEKERMDGVFELESRLAPLLAGMEHRGIKVKGNFLEKSCTELEQVKKCDETIHGVFPLTSTSLYDGRKLDSHVAKRIKSAADSGEKSASEETSKQRAEVNSGAEDELTRKVRDPMHGENIYIEWAQVGSPTGALIPKPSLKDLNLDGYTARPDHALLRVDLRQLGLRIIAQFSQDVNLLCAMKNPGDVFSNIAELWTTDLRVIGKDQRDLVEKSVRATLYGEPQNFVGLLGIGAEGALSILKVFSEKFPGLQKFRSRLITRCKKHGYVTSISGRRRRFYDMYKLDDSTKIRCEREIIDFVMQASAADIRKSLVVKLGCYSNRNAENFECHLLLDTEDELVWEVVNDHLQEAAGVIKTTLSNVSTLFQSEYDCAGFTPPIILYTGVNSAELQPLII